MRAFVFSVATLSWLMSLAINLNPFMRFDGYYLLSDALGVENMQERGFAVARWRLREMLFAFGEPPPERFAPLRHRLLITYAWATWVYRVTLHTGIALAIWLLFPKAVAIWIAGLYLVVNLLLPVVKEVGEWRKNLGKSTSPLRLSALGGLALVGVLLLFWPFQSSIVFPALASQASEERLYATADALIVMVGAAPGKTVRAGDVLFEFRSPSLQQQRRLSKLRAAALSAGLARIVADRTDRLQRVVLERELAAEMERLAGFERLAEKLVVRAGIDGKVGFLDPDLTPGLWVRSGEPLAVLFREGVIDLDGLAQERSLPHLAAGQQAKFMPDNPFAPRFAARITAIASSPAALIEPAELADRHGGDVPVAGSASGSSGPDGGMSPHGSWFRVTLAAADDVRLQGHTLRGRVEIWGSRESLAYALLRRFAGVLIRESGF